MCGIKKFVIIVSSSNFKVKIYNYFCVKRIIGVILINIMSTLF